MRTIRRWATGIALLTMAAGLVGTGVRATYSDNGSATESISVGTFHCAVTSDPGSGVVIAGNSVTITLPAIHASAAGSSLANVYVQDTGTMPAYIHWTAAGGTMPPGITYSPVPADSNLTAGVKSAAYPLGFVWGSALTNADLGQTAQVVYTAHCQDQPFAPQSKISFVGAANEATPHTFTASVKSTSNGVSVTGWSGSGSLNVSSQSTSGPIYFSVPTSGGVSPATISCTSSSTTVFSGCTTLDGSGTVATSAPIVFSTHAPMTLPAGKQAGDIALLMNSGPGSAGGMWPTGYTFSLSNGDGDLSYKVLTGSEIVVPIFANAGAQGATVAVYRGVSAVGTTSGNYGFGAPTIAFGPLTLTKTNGTSWVVGMAFSDNSPGGTHHVQATVFSPAGLTSRNASLTNVLTTGLWDTNAGVSSPSPAFSGSDNNTSGFTGYFAIELESN